MKSLKQFAGSVALLFLLAGAVSGCGSASVAWRDPNISAAIKSAGQAVVSQTQTTVAATQPWVNAGLSVTAGMRLWVDTRTDGKWTGNPKFFPYSDADGLPVYPAQYRVDSDAQGESLIGFIGSSPPTPKQVEVSVATPPGGKGGVTDTGLFEAGDTLLNFVPKTTGTLWLRNNDNTNYVSDLGQQIVKAIVTTNSR